MTVAAEQSQSRASALRRGEGTTLAAAVVFGGLGALSWLAIVLLLAADSQGQGAKVSVGLVLWLAIAVSSTAASAAFAAARFVLLALARSEGVDL